MLLGGKSEHCVIFDPVFYPFRNRHNIYHSPFVKIVSFTGITGSLGDHHHCDGGSHNNDDGVEGV